MVADPSYRNDWGFYDDTVLDEAWKKFEALSRSGQRFSLFTLTVDTHHRTGLSHAPATANATITTASPTSPLAP